MPIASLSLQGVKNCPILRTLDCVEVGVSKVPRSNQVIQSQLSAQSRRGASTTSEILTGYYYKVWGLGL